MADPTDRVPENVPGTYYVDTNCIDCDVCRDTSPENFTRADAGGYSFVFKQPLTDAERALCEEALLAWPEKAVLRGRFVGYRTGGCQPRAEQIDLGHYGSGFEKIQE